MAHSNTTDQVKREASAAAQEASDELREGARRIADEVRETASRLADSESYDRLKERGAEFASAARDAGREYAGRARDEASRLYDASKGRANDVGAYAGERYDEVAEMVRRNPAQALGIAAGIGFLVGLVLSSRR